MARTQGAKNKNQNPDPLGQVVTWIPESAKEKAEELARLHKKNLSPFYRYLIMKSLNNLKPEDLQRDLKTIV